MFDFFSVTRDLIEPIGDGIVCSADWSYMGLNIPYYFTSSYCIAKFRSRGYVRYRFFAIYMTTDDCRASELSCVPIKSMIAVILNYILGIYDFHKRV